MAEYENVLATDGEPIGETQNLKRVQAWPTGREMVFVVATDTHSDDIRTASEPEKSIYANNTRQYGDFCATVNRIAPDFFMHLGDTAEFPVATDETRLLATLDSVNINEEYLGCPKYQVAGNHDVSFTVATQSDLETFYGNIRDSYIQATTSDNLTSQESVGYYHATRGQLHIIVLNTNDRDISRPDAWYDIDATQQAWFDAELDAIPDGEDILICSHLALRVNLDEYEGSSDPKDFTIVPTTITAMENHVIDYLTTNKNSRVIGWFGGHAHENMREEVAISTGGGQESLNYITFRRSAYLAQDPIYSNEFYSFGICRYNDQTRKLTIQGYGTTTATTGQADYSIQY